MWEIVIKQGLGKLHVPDNWADVLIDEPFRQISITCQHALTVGKLPAIHRDPFDRLLVAQCLVEELTLITSHLPSPNHLSISASPLAV